MLTGIKRSPDTKTGISLCLFFFIAVGAWAFSSPTGSSPDDDFHLGSIYCGTFASEDLCGKVESAHNFPGGVVDSSVCFAFQPATNALCTEAKLSGEGSKSFRINQVEGGYPGTFYDFFSVYASKSVVETTLLIRLTNSLIFSVLVTLMLYQSRFRNKNSIIAVLTSLVPIALFIIPSTNPSSWTFIGGLTFPFFLYLYIKEGFRNLHLLLVTISLMLCLTSRGDGGIPIVLGSILVFGAILMQLVDWRKISLRTLLAIHVPIVISTFHFAYYAIIRKAISENPAIVGFNFELFLLNFYNSPKLVLGVFGSWGLGWLDTLLPSYLSISLLALAILSFYFNSLGGYGKYFVGFCLMVLMLYPSIVLTLWGTTVGSYFQPRYILPGIASMSFAILYSLNLKDKHRIVTRLYRLNTIAAAVSYAICLYINILRYSVGLGPSRSKVMNSGEYWSLPNINPWACFLVGTISMILTLLIADKLINEGQIGIRRKGKERKGDKSYTR